MIESKVLGESVKTFSFFGYEPNDLGGFDNETSLVNQWVKFSLKVMISHLSKIHQDITFISGCSPGTETWAAEEVVNIRAHHEERNIKLLVALPFQNMSGRDSEGTPVAPRPWPLKSHERMKTILESADDSVTVDEGSTLTLKTSSRDTWVLERSYGTLFVVDDDVKNARLIEALDAAEKNHTQCCIINPSTEQIYVL